MASKHCILLLVAIFVAVTISEADTINAYVYYNRSDMSIQYFGRIAVSKHNEEHGSHLYFVQVYGGYTISGEKGWAWNNRPPNSFEMEYHLDLTATNCSQSEAPGNYTAVIRITNIGTLVFMGLEPKIN